MKTDYTLSELLRRGETRQFVVPELQRDYVWDERNWQQLSTQLLAGYRAYQTVPELPPTLDDEVRRAFTEYYQQQYQGHNLGFLYAYHDPSYAGHCFLIDGQQRLTTLLLLLLAAACQGGRTAHFERHYLTGPANQPCLTYRVREAAQEFLPRFVAHLIAERPLRQLDADAPDRPYWFLRHYAHDATIARLLANYGGIATWLTDKFAVGTTGTPSDSATLTADGFYDFLHAAVRFWYFDTNHSAQGEELYLSLNASVEPLTTGDNLKAQLLSELPAADKQVWGEQFEAWEQFFWQHRGHNPDAGLGLDEFFRWVAICESARYDLTSTQRLVSQGTRDQVYAALRRIGQPTTNDQPITSEQAAHARLAQINHYATALQFLYEQWRPGAAARAAARWGLATAETEKVLPNSVWLHPTSAISAIDCFRLLPIIVWLVEQGPSNQNLDDLDPWLFRLVRYFSNLSEVSNISKQPSESAVKAIRQAQWLATTSADVAQLAHYPAAGAPLDAEVYKLLAFSLPNSQECSREEAERLCWQLEDHSYNSGEIKHLCPAGNPALLTRNDLPILRRVYDYLFASPALEHQQLQTILLAFGAYQTQASNNGYYIRYQFDNWSVTVRTLYFQALFQSLCTNLSQLSQPLSSLLSTTKAHFFSQYATPAQVVAIERPSDQLFVLAALFDEAERPPANLTGTTLWSRGNYAGWYYQEDMPNAADRIFATGHNWLSASAAFGYGYQELLVKLKELADAQGASLPELLDRALI